MANTASVSRVTDKLFIGFAANQSRDNDRIRLHAQGQLFFTQLIDKTTSKCPRMSLACGQGILEENTQNDCAKVKKTAFLNSFAWTGIPWMIDCIRLLAHHHPQQRKPKFYRICKLIHVLSHSVQTHVHLLKQTLFQCQLLLSTPQQFTINR